LRAKDMEAKAGETLVELRCPEQHCGRLLYKFLQVAGRSEAQTLCPKCGTLAQWTLQTGQRPMYKTIQRRV
jgi:phage FluMu protein Com